MLKSRGRGMKQGRTRSDACRQFIILCGTHNLVGTLWVTQIETGGF